MESLALRLLIWSTSAAFVLVLYKARGPRAFFFPLPFVFLLLLPLPQLPPQRYLFSTIFLRTDTHLTCFSFLLIRNAAQENCVDRVQEGRCRRSSYLLSRYVSSALSCAPRRISIILVSPLSRALTDSSRVDMIKDAIQNVSKSRCSQRELLGPHLPDRDTPLGAGFPPHSVWPVVFSSEAGR